MNLVDRLFKVILSTICVLLLALMLAAVIGQIVARYGFNNPLEWSEELARYSMVWLAMLGSGLAMRQNQHIAISSLPQGTDMMRTLIRWIAVAVMLTVLTAFGYYAMKLMGMTRTQTTPSLGIKMSFVYLALPVGILLTILGAFLRWREIAKAGEITAGESSTK